MGWNAAQTLTSGTYTISAVIDGQTEQVSVSVDASSTLVQPSVTIGPNPTTKSVTASWSAVPGAGGFLVRLVNRTTNAVVASARVTSLSTTFSNLSLNTSDQYAVQVYAASSNIAADPPVVPGGKFNMALGESANFSVSPAP
jgi:hypothetical protein